MSASPGSRSDHSSASPAHPLAYRPEIDGLRALAVVAVVLFHASLKCPGGYVGVDVFFVISGYLITSLILRDLRAGRFSLADFWERRVRRILPALSVVVLLSLLAGGFLFLPSDYEQLGKSAIAQALLVANVFFWRDDSTRGGYFGPTSEERPLLHTWSLAVEEQFYLFFPLLLVFLFRFERLRRSRNLSLLLLTGILAGLVLAAYGVKKHPGAAFYLLPTRAWELLCGAWIAALPARCVLQRRLPREAASWLGLTGVLLPCWLYTKETPFPGLAALPPCLGAVLVIWSNGRTGGGEGLTSVGRLLALRPVVFVGLISYSLYLWHWPVLVFGKYWWPHSWSPWYLRVGLILVAGVLAVLSWRFVETPFRKKQAAPTRKAVFRFAGVATLVSLVMGIGLVVFEGLPIRVSENVVENEKAESDKAAYDEMQLEIEDIQQGRLIPLGVKNSENSIQFLLWGDSHAMHIIPTMDTLCQESGLAGVAATHSSTPPLMNYVPSGQYSLKEQTPEFSAAIVDYIKQRSIRYVVLAARWSGYQNENDDLLERDLPATISTLVAAGCTVWILQDVPDVDIEVPKALIRAAMFRREDDSWLRTVAEHHRKNAVLYRLSEQNLSATFIDPAPLLLDPGSDRYRADIDGISIYHDGDHLTTRASRLLLLPLFREKMAAHLKSADDGRTEQLSKNPAPEDEAAPAQSQ